MDTTADTSTERGIGEWSIHLPTLFDLLPTAVLVVDLDGRVLYTNAAFENAVGAHNVESKDSPSPADWVAPTHLNMYRDLVLGATQLTADTTTIILDWVMIDRRGRRLAATAQVLTVTDTNGQPVALAWILDIDIGTRSETPEPTRVAPHVRRRLSPREIEIVDGLLRGGRVATIAIDLGISQHTVRNHLKSIFHKLGVHSQSDLIRTASRVV